MDPRIPVTGSLHGLQHPHMQYQLTNAGLYPAYVVPSMQVAPTGAYLNTAANVATIDPASYANIATQYATQPLSHLGNSANLSNFIVNAGGLQGVVTTNPLPTVSSCAAQVGYSVPGSSCIQTLSTVCTSATASVQPALASTTTAVETSQNIPPSNVPLQQVPSQESGSVMQNLDIGNQTLSVTVSNEDMSQNLSSCAIVPNDNNVKIENNANISDFTEDYNADTDNEDGELKNDDTDLSDTDFDEGDVNIDDTNSVKSGNESWPYMCLGCGETFTIKKQWLKHKMLPCKKSVNKKNCCDFCRRVFKRSDHVIRHVRTVHRSKFTLWQEIQKRRKDAKRRLTKKGRIREEMKTRTCKFCLKIFRSVEEKDVHVRCHEGVDKPYTCTVCQATFYVENQMKLHRRTRCGKNAFTCTMCDFATISPKVLQNHEMAHSGEKPYKCEACNKGFNSKTVFKCHQLRHTGKKPFGCDDCERSFISAKHLERHRVVHTGESFKCEICNATYADSALLQAHVMSHQGDKPFMCQICGSSFVSSTFLKQHLKVHGGEKSYICKYCNRPFGRSDTLKKHERTHTGEKPYVCKYCGQAYSRYDKLSKHVKSHTEEGGPGVRKRNPSKNVDKAPEASVATTNTVTVNDATTGFPVATDLMAYAYKLACEYSSGSDPPTFNPASDDQFNVDNMASAFINEQNVIKDKKICGEVDTKPQPVLTSTLNEKEMSEIIEGKKEEPKSTAALPDPIAPMSIKKEIEEQDIENESFDLSRSNVTGSSGTLESIDPDTSKELTCIEPEDLVKTEDDLVSPPIRHMHNTSTPKKTKFQCDICEKYYSSKHALQRHKMNLHRTEDKPFRCCDCQLDFSTQVLLDEHMKLHTYQCGLCPRSFISEESLRKHQEKHRNQKVHVCSQCNKAFVRKDHLQIHEKRHKGGVKHVECQYCCMAFLSKEDAAKHVAACHDTTSDKPYLCLVCREQFSTMALLITHKYMHKGQKPFKCELCNRSFRFHAALLVHTKSHSNEQGFSCDICKEKFSSHVSIKHHMLMHSGDRPFICKVCNTAFNQSAALKAHLRTHTGPKPYQCDKCGKPFRTATNLHAHERMHLGIKPHECTYCQKKFARSDTLKTHERIHRGEKPFVCSICGVAFTRKDKMKAHEKRHGNHPNGVIPSQKRKKSQTCEQSSAALDHPHTAQLLTQAVGVSVVSSSTPIISTPAPLVTATIITSSSAVSSAVTPAVPSTTPVVSATTTQAALVTAAPLASYPLKTSMPPPSGTTSHLPTYQHPYQGNPHHHLYASSTPVFPAATVGSSATTKHAMPPTSTYHGASAHVYPHAPSPYHPSPSPHYPSASPSPHTYPQVTATPTMGGYFTTDASNQSVSYHATPLFPTQPTQAYQITHTSVMHL